MRRETTVFHLVHPIPRIGARAGDRLVYQPWLADPRCRLQLVRRIPEDLASSMPWEEMEVLSKEVEAIAAERVSRPIQAPSDLHALFELVAECGGTLQGGDHG